MQPREPIYRDLLQKGITPQDLARFLRGLCVVQCPDEPIKKADSVNESVLYTGFYYHTALCFATKQGDSKMVEALLNIGANPNLYDEYCRYSVALLLALQEENDEILTLFLKIPDLDIFVLSLSAEPCSAFDLTKSNTAMICRLLKADKYIAADCSEEEINKMATTISESSQTNVAVCQSIANVYPTEQTMDKMKKIIDEECKITTPGAPLSSIIFYYLFPPKSQALINFQARYGTIEPSKQRMP